MDPGAAGPGGPRPVLSVRAFSKRFGGVLANDSISLDVLPGEVHALLGENGAGKSTLVKCIYGFYRRDAGELLVDGEPQDFHSPHDARAQGIGMVFQNLTLIPALSVVENVALFLPDLPAIPDLKSIARELESLGERYSLKVDPWALVRDLSIGQQQKAELLKLLMARSRVLILDEPTRVLAPHEVQGFFQVIQRLVDDGLAVILITHKLDEVLEMCRPDHGPPARPRGRAGHARCGDRGRPGPAHVRQGPDPISSGPAGGAGQWWTAGARASPGKFPRRRGGGQPGADRPGGPRGGDRRRGRCLREWPEGAGRADPWQHRVRPRNQATVRHALDGSDDRGHPSLGRQLHPREPVGDGRHPLPDGAGEHGADAHVVLCPARRPEHGLAGGGGGRRSLLATPGFPGVIVPAGPIALRGQPAAHGDRAGAAPRSAPDHRLLPDARPGRAEHAGGAGCAAPGAGSRAPACC